MTEINSYKVSNSTYNNNVNNINKNKNEIDDTSAVFDPQETIDDLHFVAKKGSAKIIQKIDQVFSSIPLVHNSTMDDSFIDANLKIKAYDKNGFTDYGKEDTNISINGSLKVKKDIFFNSLKSLEGKVIQKSTTADVTIGRVAFDSKEQSYKIQLKIDGLLFFNDDIDLVAKVNKKGELVVSIADKWLPNFLISDNEILTKAKNKIADIVNKQDIGLIATISNNELKFLPKIENKEIKLDNKNSFIVNRTNLNFDNTKFNIDKNGDITINFNNLNIIGSNIGKNNNGSLIPEVSSGDLDTAELDLSISLNSQKNSELFIKSGKVNANFDEKEMERIKIEDTTVNKHLKKTSININNLHGKLTFDKSKNLDSNIGADIDVNLDSQRNRNIKIRGTLATNFDSTGNFKIASKNINIKHENGETQIKEFLVQDNKESLKIHMKENDIDIKPVNVKTTKNTFNIIIDGNDFMKSLENKLMNAKKNISIETYLYSGDKAGEKVTDILLLKAAGLNKEKGKLKLDVKDGVKVKLMFDSTLGDKDDSTHESMNMIRGKYNKIINDLKLGKGEFSSLSKKDRDTAIANIEKNMKFTTLKGGITKVDHRKIIIIDGQNALSGGGINLTNSALKKHDMMLDIYGPAVRDIQKEFIENWEESTDSKLSEEEKSELLKSEEELTKIMKKYQNQTGNYRTSNTQVLVTDDNQQEIYNKLIYEIRNAKSEITIEHAYFTDQKVIDEVAKAMKKGVNINVILPEKSDEGDRIHYGNLATLQELYNVSKTSKGKFNAYFYKDSVKFNHTKAISIDREKVIVGSANLTARSMGGTFNNFLFNRELSLFIDDKKFVKELHNKLFDKDIKPEYSIKLDDNFFENLKKEQKKIDKYKQFQPFF